MSAERPEGLALAGGAPGLSGAAGMDGSGGAMGPGVDAAGRGGDGAAGRGGDGAAGRGGGGAGREASRPAERLGLEGRPGLERRAGSEGRLSPGVERRRPPTRGSLARRRAMLTLVKGLLPVVAVLLLGSVALWPEINRALNASRMTLHGLVAAEATGRMVQPRYRGVDQRGRPYTVTADSAVQDGPERVNLVAPKGDAVMQNGAWLMLQAHDGVYMQHAGQLDLQGDVTLYRQDGTVMTSDTADIDMHSGAAASNDQTHAEGPFGVLDAQGFSLVDKGSVIQFQGPAHMVLNGGGG